VADRQNVIGRIVNSDMGRSCPAFRALLRAMLVGPVRTAMGAPPPRQLMEMGLAGIGPGAQGLVTENWAPAHLVFGASWGMRCATARSECLPAS